MQIEQQAATETILKKYIRDPYTRRPIGMGIAIRSGDKIHYGFSLLNTKMDQWDKDLGTKIAIRRSQAPKYQLPKVKERESLVLDAYESLETRAFKYYKDIDPKNITLSGKIDFQPYEL